MSIIIFILILSFLIFVHELGHFLFAKKAGIRVDEFAIGFPPKIFSFQKGETKYSLNLIPFGGYVKIFGENPDEESLTGPDSSRSFVKKPRHIQALVLVAGILFNMLTAWALLTLGLMIGTPDASNSGVPQVVITEAMPASPAEEVGLKAGDIIVSMSLGEKKVNPETSEAVRNFVAESKGEKIDVEFKRGPDIEKVSLTPKEGIVEGQFGMGIAMSEIAIAKLPFFEAIKRGFEATVSITKGTAVGLTKFLGQLFTFNANLKEVAGPVGMVGMVGDASQYGIAYLLSFTALISINLAVLNLVPFPALDGGRLLFVLIEAIIRRPISPKVTNAVNALGFALLIFFMILVTTSDIGKLIR